jgi:hypothetical protein
LPSDLPASTWSVNTGSFGNNNTTPNADVLHLNTGTSGNGSSSAIMFSKDSFAVRIYRSTTSTYDTFSSFVFFNTTWDAVTCGGAMNATSLIATSDGRLKHSIMTVEDAASKVAQLRGIRFVSRITNSRSLGVIAQEVARTVPEIVRQEPKQRLDVVDPHTVNYAGLTALFIEATKELREEIVTLRKRLAFLRARAANRSSCQ